MSLPALSIHAARMLALEAQKLRLPPAGPARKADLLDSIRRMGFLQIDTIHIVARSQYMVLFSRVGHYPPAWLDELLEERRLFEFWAHAACYLPMEDFALHRRLALENKRMYFWPDWYDHHREMAEGVLGHIRANGEVSSADFESQKQPGGWWNWKEEKLALEYWFCRNELMVTRRKNFQRMYDLRERVLPGWDDSCVPPLAEVYRTLALRSVAALGVTLRGQVWDYYRLPKKETQAALKDLLAEGRLLEVAVEGWAEPALVTAESVPLLEAAENGGLEAGYTTLLSPFDPLVSDRKRTLQLFGFDFSIEFYLPAHKRLYGYYLMPLLHNGALVGRLDAKAHRKEGVFEVKGLFLEKGVEPAPGLGQALKEAIGRCAAWHNTPEVKIGRVEPEELSRYL